MVKFQYYSGDIKRANPLGFVTLEQFVDKHKNPSSEMLAVFDSIEQATASENWELKAKLKMENLFSFTVSAQFKGARAYVNIVEFNGLAQLDWDGLTIDEAVLFRDYVFEHYPQVVCSYLSPSRHGVKALLRIPIISIEQGSEEGIKEYKDYYRAIETEFGNFKGFDNSPKNMALPLFLSYDFFLQARSYEDTLIWDVKELITDSLSQKFPLPFKPYKKLKSNDKNELRAIRTVRKVISGIISSPGHTQLRSACLIFGTRVAAGYVDMYDAIREVENLVAQNAYLSKGLKGYQTTAKWGLEEGMKTPNYY